MKMKRRPKGMGSVVHLGEGRRKPFLAIIKKKTIGTYKCMEDCEKALLANVLGKENMIPVFVSKDFIGDYSDFIYNLQKGNLLPESIFEFPDLTMVNDMFKNLMVAKGIVINQATDANATIHIPTFKEIWDIEYERLSKLKSSSWGSARRVSFKNLYEIHNLPINKITGSVLQNCFDSEMNRESGSGMSKLTSMKNVCSLVFTYAMKNNIISKNENPCEYIELRSTAEKRAHRRSFTWEEIHKLIEDNTSDSKLILVYIFTGMRPIEFLGIKKEDIHLDDHYMIGGVKTEAGTARIIPIHQLIEPYLIEIINNHKSLIYANSTNTSYIYYVEIFHRTMDRLKLDHQEPYDTRHTFSTIAKLAHMDTSARKKIMGHTCKDITDDIYTHEPISFLIEEINKIKIC